MATILGAFATAVIVVGILYWGYGMASQGGMGWRGRDKQ